MQQLSFSLTSSVKIGLTKSKGCELVTDGQYVVLRRFQGSDFAWSAVNDVTDVEVLSDASC